MPIFKELTDAGQHYVQVACLEFHTTRTVIMGCSELIYSSKRSTASTVLISTKLTNTGESFVDTPCAELHTDPMKM